MGVMPRATYGPKVKARAMHVLEALLRNANQELDALGNSYVSCRWQDAIQPPQLVVQTTLRALQEVCNSSYQPNPLTKTQIRESLRRFSDFLGILEDFRIHQRGSEDWHFVLHLWSKETERNLREADKLWEQKRGQGRINTNSEKLTKKSTVQITSTNSIHSLANPMDTLIANAISSIAVPLFIQLWDTAEKVGLHIVEQTPDANYRVKALQKVLKASQIYHSKYLERYGQVKVMPGLMKESIPLDSIYTAVKFLDEVSIGYFATAEDLEKTYRESGKRRFQADSERHDGMSIAQRKNFLMVLGGPGVGKSTFLRKLGLEVLKGNKGQLQNQQIPVFIELKAFRGDEIDHKTIIAKEFSICGFSNVEAFTETALEQGKLLFLLDGLDEVPTRNMNRVIEHVENFVDQYSNNSFVVSCRIAAYRSSFQRFTDVTIADFDDAQIEELISLWFSSRLDREAETATQYWNLLQQPENAAARELAQTPLLLTFLCLVYERELTLPKKRSSLYGKALNILLNDWAAQKRLEQHPIYEGFYPELEKKLLSEIAYTSFKEDRLFFSKIDIVEHITTFLKDTFDTPKNLDGIAVLEAIEKQQGILVERATDTYSFSHLTMQEYLTALYIVNNQLIQNLVAQHLTDERWREVFLLVTGLMGRRGYEILEAIDQQARITLSNRLNPCNVIRWAEQITRNSESEYKAFCDRAFAIATASASAFGKARSSNSPAVQASARSIENARARNNSVEIDVAITRARSGAIESGTTMTVARVIELAIEIASNISSTIEVDRGKSIDNASNIASAIDNVIDVAVISDIAIDRAIDSAYRSVNFFEKLQVFGRELVEDATEQLLKLKKQLLQKNSSTYDQKGDAKKLESTWLNIMKLTTNSVVLSNDEWQCLKDYLHAYELLLCCQRASIAIPRRAWESIEDNLLKLESLK